MIIKIYNMLYVGILMMAITSFNTLFLYMFTLSKHISERHVVKNRIAHVYSATDPEAQDGVVEDIREMVWKSNKTLLFPAIASPGEKQRPSECENCFNYSFSNVISNNRICRIDNMTESTILVLILITTTHEKVSVRNAIRRTWASPTNNNTNHVRYAFLLGRHHSGHAPVEITLQEENNDWQDIIQDDFVDSYRNLTLKTVMGLRWAANNCPDSQYVMKTDNDVYVNIEALETSIRKHSDALETAVGGRCPSMALPNRFISSKWYVDVNLYPKNVYPKYCSGAAYVTSMIIVKDLVRVFPNIPYFPIEDIYISFCIKKLNYRFETIRNFHGSFVEPLKCNYKQLGVATSHDVSEQLMYKIWNEPC